MEWTKAQENAIFDRGGTLLISAAAGSGKTAVLTERAVQMMTDEENPVDADKMLIVTFSNAAAAEMRARIAKRLSEKIKENRYDQRLEKQRLLLGRAKIETIHAFCLDLLREFFNELDIPADFMIANEGTLAPLRNDALMQTMEAFYSDESFVKLAGLYGRSRNDAAIQELILKLYELSRSLPFPQQSLMQMADMYNTEKPFLETVWGEELFTYALSIVQETQASIAHALDIISENEDLLPYQTTLEDDERFFDEVNALLLHKNWNEAAIFCKGKKLTALKPVKKGNAELKEIVKATHAQAKEVLKNLQEKILICTDKEYFEDKNELAPMITALTQAVNQFQSLFFKMKVEEKLLEFSDLEHLAVALLLHEDGTPTVHAKTIQSRFDMIMIDEFQDTSTIQNQIFEAIATPEKDNMFFVGDVKQSIYRFRQANPHLFIHKKETYDNIKKESYPAQIVLGHNFRSSVAVVHGVNDVFSTIMSKQVGEITYTEEECLVQGAEGIQDASTGFAFHITQTDETFSEADYVADLIFEMIQNEEQVQGKNTILRPCTYGDFCILLRAPGKAAQKYIDALEKRGIPAYSDLGQDLSLSWVLQPVVSVLQAIDNPAQDISLLAAMLSPLFGFTPDEVNALRVQQMEGPFYATVLKSDDVKVQAFLQELDYYRNISTVLPVHELVETLLERTGYALYASAQPGVKYAGEELRSFVNWAESYSEVGYGGLNGFLKTIADTAEHGGYKKPLAAASKMGQVSIMSIHHSKGLEFPFCILAETGKLFNMTDLNKNMLFHADLGIGASLRSPINKLYPTLPKLALRSRMKKEQLSEEMRLLYVALTRAKQKMIITASPARKTTLENMVNAAAKNMLLGGITPNLVGSATSALQWLLYVFLTHPSAEALRNLSETPVEVRSTKSELEVVFGAPKEMLQTPVKEEETVLPNDTLVQTLLSTFEKEYPHEKYTTLPIKMAVSEISKKEESTILSRPSFMYEEGLSAAERGTALHSFMQYADFVKAQADFEAEISRLVQNAFLTKEVADAIPKVEVDTFFASDIAKRMMAAKEIFKEYEFITEIPATEALEDWREDANAHIIVQGIADCVFAEEDGIVLVDYKSDKVKTASELVKKYKKQLELYKQAIAPRFNIPVKECYIYSFHLGEAIEVQI